MDNFLTVMEVEKDIREQLDENSVTRDNPQSYKKLNT